MASACLPKIHHPVEIEGAPYWDGGYSANPAIFPLLHDCDELDVLLVLLSPLRRDDTPRALHEIDARITELSFSAAFMREMQTYARAAQPSDTTVAAQGTLESKLRALRFHMIDVCQRSALERPETQAPGERGTLERNTGRKSTPC